MTVTPRHPGAVHHPDVLESEALLGEVLGAAREQLGVDVVTVLRLDPGSRHLVTVLTDCEEAMTPVQHRVPVGRGLAGRVALTGSPVALEEVSEDALVNPVLLTLGVRSVLAVPVFHEGMLTAVLKIGRRERHVFGPSELAAAEGWAHEVSAVLEDYWAADERAAAAALQRSLVPSRLPTIPQLDLAGRYVPGEGGVSGDWYDVFPLPGGRVGIVMGDVAGHGLPASVVMGRLRSALRAYALEYDEPSEVLAHLDAKIVHFEPGAMATAVYAVTEPPFTQVRIASAGHFLPLVVRPSGAETPVVPVSLPLGVEPSQQRTSGTVDLAPGDALVLFTDGLVERRTRSTPRSADVFASIDSALGELRRGLGAAPAESMATQILDSLLTIEPPGDDVALLVVRRAS